jgi:Mg2+/Co2+ transporter CorC
MSHERRDFAIRACHGDTLVDTACKVSNTILEIVVGDLHDIYDQKKIGRLKRTQGIDALTRIMLDDCNFGTFCKLTSGVAETVL